MTTTTKRTYNDWSESDTILLLERMVNYGDISRIAEFTLWEGYQRRSYNSIYSKYHNLLEQHETDLEGLCKIYGVEYKDNTPCVNSDAQYQRFAKAIIVLIILGILFLAFGGAK